MVIERNNIATFSDFISFLLIKGVILIKLMTILNSYCMFSLCIYHEEELNNIYGFNYGPLMTLDEGLDSNIIKFYVN